MIRSKKKAFSFISIIVLVALIITLPVLAFNNNDAMLDHVVFIVGDDYVVVDLTDYGNAFGLEGNPLWEYLKDGEEFPDIYAVVSGDKYMDLQEYGENYVDDVSEAIAKTDALPSDEVATFKMFVGFDDDDEPILEPIEEIVRVNVVEATNDLEEDEFVITATMSMEPEEAPVNDDFTVKVAVNDDDWADTVVAEGEYAWDETELEASWTWDAIQKTEEEQEVAVSVEYLATGAVSDSLSIPALEDLEVVSVEAVSATDVEVVFNIEPAEKYLAEQFLFFADADDTGEVGDARADLDNFAPGIQTTWDNETVVVDFSDKINESGKERGLVILDDADEVEFAETGVFLPYLVFENAYIWSDNRSVLVAEFDQDLANAALDDENFDILDTDDDKVDVDFEEVSFAEVNDDEDKTKIHLTLAGNDELEAFEYYQLQVSEDVVGANSATMEEDKQTQDFRTPFASQVRPSRSPDGQILTTHSFELEFSRDVVVDEEPATVEINDQTVDLVELTIEDGNVALFELDDVNGDSPFEQGETYTIVVEEGVFADNIYRNVKNFEIEVELESFADDKPQFESAYFMYRDGEGEVDDGDRVEKFSEPVAENNVEVDLVVEFDRLLDDDGFPETWDSNEIKLIDQTDNITYSIDGEVDIEKEKLIVEDVIGSFEFLESEDFKHEHNWEIEIASNVVDAKEFAAYGYGVMGGDLGNLKIEEDINVEDIFGPVITEAKLHSDGSLTVGFDKSISETDWSAGDRVNVQGYYNRYSNNDVYAGAFIDLDDSSDRSVTLNDDAFTVESKERRALFTAFDQGLYDYNLEDLLDVPADIVVGADNNIYPSEDLDLDDLEGNDLDDDDFNVPEEITVRDAKHNDDHELELVLGRKVDTIILGDNINDVESDLTVQYAQTMDLAGYTLDLNGHTLNVGNDLDVDGSNGSTIIGDINITENDVTLRSVEEHDVTLDLSTDTHQLQISADDVVVEGFNIVGKAVDMDWSGGFGSAMVDESAVVLIDSEEATLNNNRIEHGDYEPFDPAEGGKFRDHIAIRFTGDSDYFADITLEGNIIKGFDYGFHNPTANVEMNITGNTFDQNGTGMLIPNADEAETVISDNYFLESRADLVLDVDVEITDNTFTAVDYEDLDDTRPVYILDAGGNYTADGLTDAGNTFDPDAEGDEGEDITPIFND